MRKRILRIVTGFVAAAFMLTACSVPFDKVDKSNVNGEQAKKNKDDVMDRGPVKGGTLKLFSTSPDTLNPLFTNNIYVKDFLGFVFEGLIKLDKKLGPVPVLAKDWEASEDGLTWTFHMKQNVFWHDNIPFTSEDVEFTVETILKQNTNSVYRKNLENITSFAAVDKYTFRIMLKNRNSFTAELMTFPVIPKHCFIGEDVVRSEKNMKPVGTGPFRFSSYTQKEDVKLVLNDKWWGSANSESALPSLPYIAEIQVRIFEEGKDAVNAFHTVDIDAAMMNGADSAKYKGRQDLIMKKYPGRNYEFLAFNLTKPVFQSKAVRQAIAYAVDRVRIVNDILPGQAVVTDIPVIPNSWINDSSYEFYTPNKDKARELLTQDGWKNSSYGLYKYVNGVYTSLNLEILVNEDNETRLKLAHSIAEQLNEVGIKLQVKKVNWDSTLRLLNSKQYDIALLGCQIPITPDLTFLYGSWNSAPQGGNVYNASGYSNSVVDNLLAQILAENDTSKRKALFSECKKVVMDELPYLGLYLQNESMLYNKRIRGEINPDIMNRYSDITRWYLP